MHHAKFSFSRRAASYDAAEPQLLGWAVCPAVTMVHR
jgi:hypothetical protein